MRQGQQNRRGRGRSNNNSNNNNNNNSRKSQNPLTRSFESTGPDVKIRGTAAHVAEKYMSLARDASSSGDPVLAENYLQHAEHYNRIILAYREQQISQGSADPMNGRTPRHLAGPDGDGGDEFGDDDGDESGFDAQPPIQNGDGQNSQPSPPRNFDNNRNFDNGQSRYENRPNRHDNGRNGNQRFDRNDNRGDNRGDRGYRPDNRGDRGDNNNNGDREPRQDFRPDFRGDRHQGDRNNSDRNNNDRQGGNRGGGDRYDRGPRADRPERNDRPDRDDRVNSNGSSFRDQDERPQQPVAAQPMPAPMPPPMIVPTVADPVEVQEAPPVRRRERPQPPPAAAGPHLDQPEFLRRPVRRPRRDAAPAGETPVVPVDDQD